MKRILCVLTLTTAMMLSIIPQLSLTVYAATEHAAFNLATGIGNGQASNYCWDGTVLTVNDGADIEITGVVTNGRRIEVAADATVDITLNTISITTADNQSPFLLNAGATATVTLIGNNALTAGTNCAGIQAPDGSTLIISKESDAASLTVKGGNSAPGIGGGKGENGGSITINGGTITATGGEYSAAGIGGAGGSAKDGTYYPSNGGTITINGGTITATGGHFGAGIGGGDGGGAGTITITGGAITATGGSFGAGIGGANGGGADTITITGGTITATGGSSGIGGGTEGSGGIITVSGGTITAMGYNKGIGIGGSSDPGIFNMNGNGIVCTHSVSDTDTSRRTGGMLFIGNNGTIYGENFILNADFLIPAGRTLTIPDGSTLTVPNGVTLVNNGSIIEYGAIVNLGEIISNQPTSAFDLTTKTGTGRAADYTWSGQTLSVKDGAFIEITGSAATKSKIIVESYAAANIILKNVSIDGLEKYQSPLSLHSSSVVNLFIEGENYLTAGSNSAGIEVGNGAALTISGSGTITATGSNGGAGIGGEYSHSNSSITINSGTITAIGGGNGAGIGGGGSSDSYNAVGGDGGNIVINGGTVTAIGGKNGAGIGGGGTSNRYNGVGGDGGNIVINGGIITATGGGNSDGIGRGGTAYIYGDPGTFTMNGNGVVFTTSVSDTATSRRTGGILFIGNHDGIFYSTDIILTSNATFPSGKTLTMPNGTTLTIPEGITLTNNGTITPANGSAISVLGVVAGNKITGANVPELTITGKTDNSLTLSAVSLLAETGQEVEYSINTINSLPVSGWQKDGFFIIEPNTRYYFFARSKANDNFNAGAASSISNHVTNVGGYATITYSGTSIDLSAVSELFTVDSNAGARTYTLDGGTGVGTIGTDGNTLTVTKAGNFIIGLTTAETESHAAGAKVTATLTINKGTQSAPTGLGKTDATSDSSNDGKIVNLTPNTRYAYKKNGGNYIGTTSNSHGEITGLSAGHYVVCLSENNLYNRGADSANITIQPTLTASAFNLSTGIGCGRTSDYSWNGTVLTINNGADIEITGSVSNQRRIVVETNATVNITLNNVSITGLGSGQSPIILNDSSNAIITLIGNNLLTGGSSSDNRVGAAGIQSAGSITIIGNGLLKVTGGNAGWTNTGGAGIEGGTIRINGGVITATGGVGGSNLTIPNNGQTGGAGITGIVEINGGVISATGGNGGRCSNNSTGPGGAGIAGTIIVSGGYTTAVGGQRGGDGTRSAGISGDLSRINGISFVNNAGMVCGTVTVVDDLIISSSETLAISNEANLIIPEGITLTNNGVITPANGSTVNVLGTVTGNKINGADIIELSASNNAGNSVTINASLAAMTGQDIEYAYSTENVTPSSGWQNDTMFNGLTPNTLYYFFARSKENSNFYTGAVSSGMALTTNRINVVNSGGKATVMYSGTAIDLSAISSLFTVTSGAGVRIYSIVAGGTGSGAISSTDNKTLMVTKAGSFIISLETAATQTHTAGSKVEAVLTITKAIQSTPTGLGKANVTTQDGSDGKITGLTANTIYEYKKDGNSYVMAFSNASGEITGLTSGSYIVRLPENDLYFASADSAVIIIDNGQSAPLKIDSIIPDKNTLFLKISNPVYGAALIVAVYDGKGKLLKLTKETITPEIIIENKITLENIAIPTNPGTIVKAMVWDEVNSIQPICNSKTAKRNADSWVNE